jgi:hypothetical protein
MADPILDVFNRMALRNGAPKDLGMERIGRHRNDNLDILCIILFFYWCFYRCFVPAGAHSVGLS